MPWLVIVLLVVAMGALLLAASTGRWPARERRGLPARVDGPDASGWQALERELRRARRHGRALTVGRVEPSEVSAAEATTRIGHRLRTTDVCFASDPYVYVAMPEAAGVDAELAMRRLCRPMTDRGVSCTMEIATYPDDALTARALIEGLRRVEVAARARADQ